MEYRIFGQLIIKRVGQIVDFVLQWCEGLAKRTAHSHPMFLGSTSPPEITFTSSFFDNELTHSDIFQNCVSSKKIKGRQTFLMGWLRDEHTVAKFSVANCCSVAIIGQRISVLAV